MRTKWMYSVPCAVLLLGASVLLAQEPPPGPPPGPGDVAFATEAGGFVAGKMEILGFGEMHPGKVVTGAPYSAVAVTETRQTLSDGNTIDRKVQANVFRDAQGRTRRETTLAGLGPLATAGQTHSFVMIHDPVASAAFVLHPDQKVAEKLPFPPGGGKNGQFQQKFEVHRQEEIGNGTMKKEGLGTQTIEGISAQGTRYTHTIPAGQIGNEKPIVVTSEQWYSPDLQIVVKSTRNDPRFGETTYTLTNVQRHEPAASLFTLPSDYTVQQPGQGGHFFHRTFGPGQPGNPGDVPPPPEA